MKAISADRRVLGAVQTSLSGQFRQKSNTANIGMNPWVDAAPVIAHAGGCVCVYNVQSPLSALRMLPKHVLRRTNAWKSR